MDRTEQMQESAERYAEEVKESFTGSDEDKHQERLVTINDFVAGWQEADRTRWISVKDELPKHDTDENGHVSFPMVLVCLYDGYRDTSYYDDIGEEWGDYDGEVEYWMLMPEAPRKEGNNG